MNDFTFSVPQNIMVGRGSLAKLPEAARQLGGSHAFIISGPHLTKMGLVDKVSDSLKAAGFAVDAFTETEGNPSTDTVEKAAAAYKASGAHKVPGKIVPLIAIPTTAGTGSEVTAFSVITDHRRDYKLTVFSYELLPACAILDAELLTSAPASVAAACGIDAFIHAEEAYVSRAASPFSDAMAEKAMELLGGNIRRFVACREDIEAAENMLVGSLFAGIAFSFARLGNVHAMSHPISAYFDVPHGVANAVLLPVIAEYNALADHGRYFKIFNYISPLKVDAGEFEPGLLPGAIRELCGEIGIPNGIVEAVNNASRNGPVSREAIEEKIEAMAADAMKSGNIAVNPRASRQSDIEMLYRRAL